MTRQAVIKKEKTDNDSFILSRIRIVRNIADYPFTDNLNEDNKNHLENNLLKYISSLKEKTEIFDTSYISKSQV